MEKVKSKPAKPLKPKTEIPPAKETFLADVWPKEKGLVRALRKANITTVEQLKPLTDAEILAIPGVNGEGTRFNKILKLIGRKSEAEQARQKRLEALRNG